MDVAPYSTNSGRRYVALRFQLGLGLLVTIRRPPSPLPARLEDPERMPLKVPIDVRGTARLLARPFRKLPRLFPIVSHLALPSHFPPNHQQVKFTTFDKKKSIRLLRFC